MAKRGNVSLSVIRRLPRYYRFLGELLQKNVTRISSRELAQLMQLTASQIRQDLNCFGGFGQQGYGYNVAALHTEIGKIMGLDKQTPMILIGAGNLGRTIAKHMNFEKSGFKLIGIFDNNPEIIGTGVRQLTVSDAAHLRDFCLRNHPVAAILCIPRENTRQVVEELLSLGIRNFWNFSHYDLSLDFENVVVENVHLGDSLMTFCYQVNEASAEEESDEEKSPIF